MANPKTTIQINAKDNTKRAFASVNKSIGNVTGSMRMLSSVAIVGAVAGLSRFISSTVKAADNIGKMSRTVGLSAEAFQELGHAAKLSGVDMALFESSMTAFVKRVGEAKNGMGPLTTGLKGWNDELLTAIKNSKNQEEAFRLLSDASAKATTATAVAVPGSA